MMMMMMIITIATTTTMIMIMMIMMMRSIINMMIGNRLVSTSGRGRENDHLLFVRWRWRWWRRRRKLDRRGRRLDHRRRWRRRRRRRYCDGHVDHTTATNAFPLLLGFVSPHFNLLLGYEGRELFALDRL